MLFPRSSEAVYDFRKLLLPSLTLALLVPVTEAYIQEQPQYEVDGSRCGIVVLWRMISRLRERDALDSKQVADTVLEALDLAVPVDLTLAARIEQHFATSSSQSRGPLHPVDPSG